MKHWTTQQLKDAMKKGVMPDPDSSSSSDDERKRKTPAGKPKPEPEAAELQADEYDAFFEEVKLQKEKVTAECPPHLYMLDFLVEPIGTKYTWKHTSLASDIITCAPKSEDAKELLLLFFQQKMVSYSIKDRFTFEEATTLGFMYANKWNHFLKIWKDNGKPKTFRWTTDHVNAFQPLQKHIDFVQNLRPGSNVPSRLKQVENLKPKVVV